MPTRFVVACDGLRADALKFAVTASSAASSLWTKQFFGESVLSFQHSPYGHFISFFVRLRKGRRRPLYPMPMATLTAPLEERIPAVNQARIGHLNAILEHSHFPSPCQRLRARFWSWKIPLPRRTPALTLSVRNKHPFPLRMGHLG